MVIDEPFDYKQSDYDSPMALMAVCRRWRDIITHSGLFWNSLMVHEEDQEGVDRHLAARLLARSGNAPLDLVCYDTAFSQPFFELFKKSHSQRIRRFEFAMESWESLELLSSLPTLPSLTHLDVVFEDFSPDGIDDTAPAYTVFAGSKELQHFSITSTEPGANLLVDIWPTIVLEYANLTHLEIHGAGYSFLEEGLVPSWTIQCVNLVALKDYTAYQDWSPDNDASASVTVLPHLEFYDCNSMYAPIVIKAPALHTLVINDQFFESSNKTSFPFLDKFLKLSACRLRHLIFMVTQNQGPRDIPYGCEGVEEVTVVVAKDAANEVAYGLSRWTESITSLQRLNFIVRCTWTTREVIVGYDLYTSAYIGNWIRKALKDGPSNQVPRVKVTYEVTAEYGDLGTEAVSQIWDRLALCDPLYMALVSLKKEGAPLEIFSTFIVPS